MPVNLTKYNDLKEQAKTAKEVVARAEGALEQHMRAIKDEFDCDTIEKAETLLDSLTEEYEELDEKAETLLADFEAQWKENLADDE
jgi:hypothetical protein